MLHEALAEEGIHVAQLIIPGGIDGGDPLFASDALAERLWQLHAQPGAFRVTVGEDVVRVGDGVYDDATPMPGEKS
jgi:hypothetical protein